ncbi:MAG: hypothetical protein QF521_13675 [Alphaproteobacteria bacterium]|nr:hypothetical protein [Alphaproteobacteria bacterium]
MQQEEKLAGSRFAPKPIGKLAAGDPAGLCRCCFHIECPHVFGSAAKALSKAERSNWLVGRSSALQQGVQETRGRFNFHSGGTDAGAATGFPCQRMPRREAGQFPENLGEQGRAICGIRRRKRNGAAPPGHVHGAAAWRIVWKVIENGRAVAALQKSQGCPQHVCLKFRFVGCAEGAAKFEWNP